VGMVRDDLKGEKIGENVGKIPRSTIFPDTSCGFGLQELSREKGVL